jgi:SAM-dependent methyltransferase
MNFESTTQPIDTTENQTTERVTEHVKTREEDYWSSFYEKNDFNKGSTFQEFVSSHAGVPEVVIDIGCGQGRDSFAFAQAGKTVIGLDRSDVGIEHANNKARTESLDSLNFAVCDVSNEEQLAAMIESAREQADGGDVCFYMRFFLHSIPEETQDALMQIIADHTKPGDVFAAEFRTDKDEDHTRVFGDTHYRRYQNADEFSMRLKGEYGWGVAFETEDRGLSPYKDEDPTLYRVIATRQ